MDLDNLIFSLDSNYEICDKANIQFDLTENEYSQLFIYAHNCGLKHITFENTRSLINAWRNHNKMHYNNMAMSE